MTGTGALYTGSSGGCCHHGTSFLCYVSGSLFFNNNGDAATLLVRH